MNLQERAQLVDRLCAAYSAGPEARQRLATLGDRIVADSGGELTADETEAIVGFGLSLDVAARAKRATRVADPVAGLVALAEDRPGAADRIARLSADLTGGVVALSASNGGDAGAPRSAFDFSETVPSALTPFDRETCAIHGLDEGVTLRAAQQQARVRLR